MSESETITQMLQENPLLKFSFFTHIQVETLKQFGGEIISNLSDAFDDNGIDGEASNRIYGHFWLWVLGAYEVVRTASRAEGCFTATTTSALTAYLEEIERLRMPFAKQELKKARKAKAKPAGVEPSIYGVDMTTKDMSFEVDGVVFSMRGLIRDFVDVFSQIGPDEIIRDHRATYGS